MGFNSVELSIADVVSRFSDPADRRAIEETLEAAERRVGVVDGQTSELEARDYVDRSPTIFYEPFAPALRHALNVLASAEPPRDISGNALMFQELRSTFARVGRELESLEYIREPGPTLEQSKQIAKLTSDFARAVKNAHELAKQPQFAAIVGHANAAIIRVASLRAYGMFADDVYATPAPLEATGSAALINARLQLGAVRNAAEHVSDTVHHVGRGAPRRVDELVTTLYRVRAELEELPEGSREVANLRADFNATLQLVATTQYRVWPRSSPSGTRKLGDEKLPEPLSPAS